MQQNDDNHIITQRQGEERDCEQSIKDDQKNSSFIKEFHLTDEKQTRLVKKL